MDVNYLAYAQEVGRQDPNARGLSQIGATLEAQRERARLAPQEEQASKLRALQIQQTQMGVDDTAAKQGALTRMGGTLQGAYEQQMQREQEQQKAAARQKGMETYLNTLKALDGMPSLNPAVKTEIGKHFLKQNPEYAPIAENLSFIDSKGVKAARQFGDGELKDPVTGQPLPAGYYETDGVWTGDAANPVKLTSYKLVPEKPAAEKLQIVEIPSPDGRTAQKFSVDLVTGTRTAIGQPYAVKSQVVNVNTGGGGTGGVGTKKPLPVAALKLQQEAVDAIGIASGIRADLGAILRQIESGKLQLGPVTNFTGGALNRIGMSTENSRNLATFKATLEKLRNDSLRLNKGVQTDGDAQRAWNELMTNISDPGVVKQRLSEIDRLNERAVVLHQANIENVRSNYGIGPLDTSKQRDVKPALGKKPGPIVTKGGFKVTRVP